MGGIPAKPLMTIEDYYDKTKGESLKLPWIDRMKEYSLDELNFIREKYYFEDSVIDLPDDLMENADSAR